MTRELSQVVGKSTLTNASSFSDILQPSLQYGSPITRSHVKKTVVPKGPNRGRCCSTQATLKSKTVSQLGKKKIPLSSQSTEIQLLSRLIFPRFLVSCDGDVCVQQSLC